MRWLKWATNTQKPRWGFKQDRRKFLCGNPRVPSRTCEPHTGAGCHAHIFHDRKHRQKVFWACVWWDASSRSNTQAKQVAKSVGTNILSGQIYGTFSSKMILKNYMKLTVWKIKMRVFPLVKKEKKKSSEYDSGQRNFDQTLNPFHMLSMTNFRTLILLHPTWKYLHDP